MTRLPLHASIAPGLALGRDHAKLAGSDFRYAVLFAPPDRHASLAALHAVWHEIAEIPDECSDPVVAAHKLGWWQEEVASFFEGRARHPASLALRALVREDELARAPFDRLIETVGRSLAPGGFADLPELLEHGRHREGALYALAAQLLGAPQTDLGDLGAGLRLAQLIAGLGAEVRRGRLGLPRAELSRRGIAEADVLARRSTPAIAELLASLHARAMALLAPPVGLAPADRLRLAPLFAPAAIARATLTEIARDGYRVLARAIVLTPLRKLWIAWRATRAAARNELT